MAAAIGAHFERLAASDPEDVVVVCFSGHGTDTHELVTHDTDPYDLAGTTNPLTMLSDPLLRRLNDSEVIRPLSATRNNGKGLGRPRSHRAGKRR